MLGHTFPALLQNFVSTNLETRKEELLKVGTSSIVYPICYLSLTCYIYCQINVK